MKNKIYILFIIVLFTLNVNKLFAISDGLFSNSRPEGKFIPQLPNGNEEINLTDNEEVENTDTLIYTHDILNQYLVLAARNNPALKSKV